MPPKNIVISPNVTREKLAIAKELRRNMTEQEKILWLRLRGNCLDGLHIRRQQVILGYIVDFYCHKASLAIELDGSIHSKQKQYDSERDTALSEIGIRVIRIPNRDVEDNIEGVLDLIRDACRERIRD